MPEVGAHMDVTRETILVVDDEEGMRDVIRAILEDEGYRVFQAAATEAAVYEGTRALRDTILHTLSHELRTPMMFLMGYGELLEKSAHKLQDKEFFDFLHGLRTGSERLLHLVESALLLSKLESGALQGQEEGLEVQTFQPDPLVADTVKGCQSQAAARLVSLALHQGAAGAIIAADPRFFVEIVRRLVDNAIKFSKAEGGGVILRTYRSWSLGARHRRPGRGHPPRRAEPHLPGVPPGGSGKNGAAGCRTGTGHRQRVGPGTWRAGRRGE